MLGEIHQTEKDKYCVISHVESKNVTHWEKKKKSRMVVARGLGSGSEKLLVKGYKLPIMR